MDEVLKLSAGPLAPAGERREEEEEERELVLYCGVINVVRLAGPQLIGRAGRLAFIILSLVTGEHVVTQFIAACKTCSEEIRTPLSHPNRDKSNCCLLYTCKHSALKTLLMSTGELLGRRRKRERGRRARVF